MIGYHCKLALGSYMETTPFFSLFEMTWLIFTGWLPGLTNCLTGAII